MQIDLTWNLFATPIFVAISTIVITRFMHNRDKAREKKELKREEEKAEQRAKYAKLLAEKEALKEKELFEWRNSYSRNVCDIKEKIEVIATSLNGKVSSIECDERSQRKWQVIRHHSHTDAGKVVEG